MRTLRALLVTLLGLLAFGLRRAQVSSGAQPTYVAIPFSAVRVAPFAPVTAPAGTRAEVNIKLLDGAGRPTTANQDITLRVSAPGAKVDKESVVIPKGRDGTEVFVTGDHPGLSEIRVEPTQGPRNLPTTLAGGVTNIGFSPNRPYHPVLPVSLSLS